LLSDKIQRAAGDDQVVAREIVADSLVDYLRRHPEMDNKLSKNGKDIFTTDSEDFNRHAKAFYGSSISVKALR
jgi:glutamate racemase